MPQEQGFFTTRRVVKTGFLPGQGAWPRGFRAGRLTPLQGPRGWQKPSGIPLEFRGFSGIRLGRPFLRSCTPSARGGLGASRAVWLFRLFKPKNPENTSKNPENRVFRVFGLDGQLA